MKMKKTLAVVLSVLLCTGVAVGCVQKDNSNSSNANNTQAEKLEQVELKIMIPGDRPAAMDNVIAEAESKMKDTVNAKLNVVFIPWADLADKTQVTLASGEAVDLIFDAPWLHLSQMASEGYYEPLDELLEKYGKNVKAVRPDIMWEANAINGEIVAIPLGSVHASGRCFMIRKDIREALELPEIKSFDALEEYLYAVKEKYPDMLPLYVNKDAVDMSYSNVRVEQDYDLGIKVSPAFGQSLVLYVDTHDNDGKIHNLFDEMNPGVWDYMKKTEKMYQDGIIDKDLMANQQDLFQAGKAACSTLNDIVLDYNIANVVKQADPNAEIEIFTGYQFEKGANVTDYKQWNFLCIPKVSQNKERAMMFLDWAQSSQENYDLLTLGIKGETWEETGEHSFKRLNSDYPDFSFAWLWNPQQVRWDSNYTEEELDHKLFTTEADNFTPSVLTGFSFDTTNVTNEMAQWNTLEKKYYYLIMNGVVDVDQYWEQFKKEAYEPVKTIQEELQKQIDEFLAEK